jgi:hypothetical protein
MQGRTQHKELIEFFGKDISVTHGTMDSIVSLPGPVDIYQFQFDVLTAASDTSFQISTDGDVIKTGAFSSAGVPGTREVSFYGRSKRAASYIEITRKGTGESWNLYWTLIYRP